MNELLSKVIAAHGGIERWKEYERVDVTIVSGGGLFPLKGVPQDSNPRRMTVWLHEERSSVMADGAPDQRPLRSARTMSGARRDNRTSEVRWPLPIPRRSVIASSVSPSFSNH